MQQSLPTSTGPSPELNASIASLLTWHWINPFIALGNHKILQAEDLYELTPNDKTLHCEDLWRKAASDHGQISVWALLFRSLGKVYFRAALWKPLWLAAVIVQVYVLKALLQMLENRRQHFQWWYGVLLVLAMLISSIVQSISQNNLFISSQRISMRARSMVSMAIFDKLLSLKLAASTTPSHGGTVLNLLTNDTQKLVDAGTYFHFVWFAPVEIIVICSLTIAEAGIAAVPGVILVFLSQLFPVWMASAVGRFRRKAVHYTDTRVRLLGEVLKGIKTIKFNGWNAPFLRFIAQIRKNELKWIRKAAFVKFSTSTLKDGVIPLATIVIFGTYATIHGKLSASMAFPVLALLSVLLRVFNFAPTGVQYAGEALTAVQRLQRLLNILNVNASSRAKNTNEIFCDQSEVSVFVMDGWFSWVIPDKDKEGHVNNLDKDQHLTNAKETFGDKSRIQTRISSDPVQENLFTEVGNLKPVLKCINMTIHKGKLVGITGAVGSGKSSFLLSLLGETECLQGVYLTEKPAAYVPQQPWIVNDSIRNNVLLGCKYDASRYHGTMAACALDYDVSFLPAAHDTEIGERGVNLSGGQKARIALARACYSYAPLVLLDDPFAAIDVPTAKHLMQHVLHGVLKGRTIILTTHNKTALDCCDETYVIDAGKLHIVPSVHNLSQDTNGTTIEGMGTHDVSRGDPLKNLSSDSENVPPSDSPQPELQGPPVSDSSRFGKTELKCSINLHNGTVVNNGALTVKEDRVEGIVTWTTYITYFRAGRLCLFILAMAIFLLTQAARVLVSYWVAIWSDDQYDLKLRVYVGSYACILFGASVLSLTRAFMFSHVTNQSAKILHSKMVASILHSPLQFFEENPTGRILNRLSKDQATVDELLPNSAQSMLESLVGCLGSIATIAVLIPWFLLVLPPFSMALFYFQHRYTAVSRELKRLDGISRSPVYAHFTETLQGITSVRAYNTEATVRDKLARLIDENHRAYILFLHVSRWLGFRLDLVAAFCVTMTALFIITFRDNMVPGLAGVVLVQSLQLTGLFQYGIRMVAETENHFTNVERVRSYTCLPRESPLSTPSGLISTDWPSKGEIEFINYTMAYRKDLPPVLRNISLKVRSQEKVGILGRTGAGKSSFTMALFHMVDNAACSGCILIDGVDIKAVGLEDLRQRLSVIPQDPVLFEGTIRMNLDPCEQHTDNEIYEALARAQLRKKIQSLEKGLYTVIKENGDNLSVGQCQLLCFARAILRRSKILVIDEATAAVDTETDELIQAVLQKEFPMCTVLTIAHRINTISNCDRLLVFDHGGHVAQYDCPRKVLKDAGEEFRVRCPA